MNDLGDRLLKLAGLLYPKANVFQRVRVIRDRSQPARGEFVLDVNNDQSLHGCVLFRSILGSGSEGFGFWRAALVHASNFLFTIDSKLNELSVEITATATESIPEKSES
jgi:hypothetical protein